MEPELFDMLYELEMRDQQEEMQRVPDSQRIRILHPDAAKLLAILATSNKAKVIVEIGSGVGYSTMWLAYTASLTGGKVIACELDPARAGELQTNLDKAGLAEYVEILSGDAREELRHRDEPVDFLFIDGDNGQYETYFDVVYKQMGTGAMVVADDVVTEENELADYTTYVQNHPSLESMTVPVGNGLEVTVKTSD